LNCWAGDNSLSNTTVSRQLRGTAPSTPRLALADEELRIRPIATLHQAGHHVGAGGVDEQRQLVERGFGVVAAVGGRVTPTSTMRSGWCAR